MKRKRLACAFLLVLLTLPLTARADVLIPGQKPPRNEQSEAFAECYKDALVPWDDAYAAALDNMEYVVFWQYPGSGQVKDSIGSGSISIKLGEEYGPYYVDDAGRFWAYVHYAYGTRLTWVCVSEPGNDHLPADPEIVAAVDKAVAAIKVRENAPAVLLVVGIAAVTGVLLYVFWHRKKKAK